MLRWMLVFLVVALLVGMFGRVGIDGMPSLTARVLFFVFLILFVASLLLGGPGRTREAR